jgi:NRAMP (natural resistance-associated macrophage protein)-like metal ion transporter
MKTSEELLKKSVEVPAELLDSAVVAAQTMTAVLPATHMVEKTKGYWHMLGPGLTTGASDDDPSGIATYSQTGAQFGFKFLWLAPLTFPLMAIVQEMCARIGLVTGRGLAGNIRIHFSKRVLQACTLALFVANTFNIGADLGAMAKAVQLLNPRFNFGLVVIALGLISLYMQIFTPYVKYARYLKWLAMVLFAYVFSALMAHLNWGQVLSQATVPHISFNREEILLVVAILGTTISPYLFFWQTSQEVEEQILLGKNTVQSRQTTTTKEEMRSMRIDVWSGMFLSNLVMFFIIAACGGVLFANGITNIETTAQAAEALKPLAGNATYLLFSVGVIGTGLLAIPVLAGASSYALAESFRWKEGLYRKLNQAHAFYGIIIISMLVGLGINFIGLDPIKALIYAAIGNALAAPIVLALIVMMSSNKRIMGRWVNKRYVTVIGWIVTATMAVAGVAAIYSIFF